MPETAKAGRRHGLVVHPICSVRYVDVHMPTEAVVSEIWSTVKIGATWCGEGGGVCVIASVCKCGAAGCQSVAPTMAKCNQ